MSISSPFPYVFKEPYQSVTCVFKMTFGTKYFICKGLKLHSIAESLSIQIHRELNRPKEDSILFKVIAYIKRARVITMTIEIIHETDNPVEMNIGYRANEIRRANKMLLDTNCDGISEFKATFEKHPNGDNKWVTVPWRRPKFPLIEDGIKKPQITKYWEDKEVRFAEYNNCVGCFNRDPLFLRYMFQQHQNKMNWFKNQEAPGMTFKDGFTYAGIEKLYKQQPLYPENFNSCDTGYCEME